jgi:PTH2 family peptidyl-tRNA hydrolase
MAKQVIVMRTDLNMRKGKMVAQGVHASLAALRILQNDETYPAYPLAMQQWMNDNERVITVRVDSLDELLSIEKVAAETGLPVAIVMDLGLTEFHGEPTQTCLAIGPAPDEVIDLITGKLALL